MVAGTVRVHGLRELNSALRKAPAAIEFGMKGAHKNAADIVFKAAEPKTPVSDGGGSLKATMRVLASKRRGAVAAGKKAVPYAAHVHWGSLGIEGRGKNIRPNPWVWDALTKKRSQVEAQFLLDLNKIIAKAFLSSGSKVVRFGSRK